jgi:ectoine hydroxylase-related dioxygenase (phytanoyl-CoA dioxygenase family)
MKPQRQSIPMLQSNQIEQYRRDGFLALPDVLSPARLSEACAVIDEFVEQARERTEDDSTFVLEPSHSRETPRLARINQPVKAHPIFERIMRSDEVLERVADLIGPDIRYHHSKLNMKTASVGSPVEWHQDFVFFPHTNDDVLAVGIALDDCTPENGCLLVIPGSHRRPILDHHQDGVFVGGVPSSLPEVAMDKSVAVIVPAGGMSVHHSRTLHASAPNRSSKPRRLLLIEYAAADAWPIGVDIKLDDFHARIVRGHPTRKARLVDMHFDMRQRGLAGSIYELQRKLQSTAFAQAQVVASAEGSP